MKQTFDLSLYLVTDAALSKERDLQWIVQQSLKGGVTMVQLREKNCSTNLFVEKATALLKILRPLGVSLIINDRIDVALAVDADGVHIGQSDMPYHIARKILGYDKIIGLSVETLSEVEQANHTDVDYIGVSPVFDTGTKTDTLSAFGLDGLKKATSISRHRIVAIGGMNESTACGVMQCGVEGIAVVSAIVSAESPQLASANLLTMVNENRLVWSDVAWNSIISTLHDIENMPFNVEMMRGTLPIDKFITYLEQDIIYIANYGQEMNILADMLEEGEMKHLFKQFAHEGMEAERTLHQMLREKFGINNIPSPSPVTKAYMAHTRSYISNGDVELSLAAILPCLWIYSELGKFLAENCTRENNPYIEWIDTYSSSLMEKGVRLTVDMCNRLAASTTTTKRYDMISAFVKAVNFEFDFFEYGYSGMDEKRFKCKY